MNRPLIATVGSLLFLISLIAFGGEDTNKILDNLQKKYESLQDISIKFTQKIVFGVTQNEETFKGTLLVKKGNKYRIDLENQIISTDGNSVWSYSAANNQVLIDKYREDPRSISPDKILVNVPDRYTTTFVTKEKNGDLELTVLKLIPKDKTSNVQWMKIWVDTDEWIMKKVQLQDMSDNITTYTVEDIKYNSGISDGRFQIETPKGAQVIDLR
ncbi:MAG: outer membrane lipoprotein carrier protein LolA [Bacteroidota bacterium]